MRFKSSFTIPAVAAISFCLIGPTFPAAADILHVPGDYLTIQEAIDAAMDGDEVEVQPGTYNENINLFGKAITVRSSDGAGVTTIDAGGIGTVVTCTSMEGPDTILDGFTITGGDANYGGGMRNSGSSPTVTNCTFSGNSADDGGGMYNTGSSPTVTDCTFSGNSVNGDQSFGQGGGVYNGSNSNSTFTNCVFASNNAGGDGASGGAMYNSESDPLLINCLFTNNEACEGAGGMTNNHSNPVLINCTFSHTLNSFEGALLNLLDSNPTVIGCILWDTGMPPITGRATVTYSCIQGGWRGIGNIEANPMFVDPDGPDNDIFTWEDNDYRLSPGSPSIDAGNNWGVPIDANDYDEDGILCELFPVDLDGNPRFNADEADFDPGCGVPVVVDMGAYEYQFDPADQVTFADLNGDDAVGVADLLGLLASWGPCAKGCCLADLDIDGFVGISDLLVLLANWGPCP